MRGFAMWVGLVLGVGCTGTSPQQQDVADFCSIVCPCIESSLPPAQQGNCPMLCEMQLGSTVLSADCMSCVYRDENTCSTLTNACGQVCKANNMTVFALSSGGPR